MKRWESLLLHSSNLLVGGTGLVYAVMVYVLTPEDPYSRITHPLQPTFQHLHVLFAPLLVFTCGVIWNHHILRGWKSKSSARRWSGLVLLTPLIPMTLSGYLFQTTSDPTWRTAWGWIHLITGILWVAAYLGHWISPKASRSNP